MKPSRQDLQLGHDKPHIEINDQSHSGYGGVTEVQLKENSLVLKLDSSAASKMSVDDTLEIAFHVSKEKLLGIGNQLRLLLGNDIVRINVGM